VVEAGRWSRWGSPEKVVVKSLVIACIIAHALKLSKQQRAVARAVPCKCFIDARCRILPQSRLSAPIAYLVHLEYFHLSITLVVFYTRQLIYITEQNIADTAYYIMIFSLITSLVS
jgi:hypothetical protein